jgi:TRAP-type mannitol/chloroaromatic compound transport system permease small subunit
MKDSKTILDYIDSINEWVGRVLCFLVVLITLLVVYEVAMRRIFGAPTIWTFETTKQLYAAHFMLLTPFALLHRSHVSVTIFYQAVSARKQAILDIIGYLVFFFPFCVIVLWQGFLFAEKSWGMQETSWSVFSPPLYFVKTVIPVTAALLLLQGISIFIRRVRVFIKGEAA